jgi:hypothetical protein
MACQDCFKNCGNSYTSDKCVEYTGPDIPILGICTGDTLSIVEAQIFEHLIAVMDGTGIIVEEVTLDDCPWLRDQFVGKDKTLVNLFQLLIDNQCALKEQLDSFTGESQVFDTKCLTGLPVNPSSVDILQATVTLLCSVKTTVDAIPSTYVKLSDLTNLVLQIMGSNPTNGSFPKSIPVPYIGSLSNFDNTGKGLGQYVGWYMMNGLNGTQDWRGRKVVGAVRNVPGGALDADINPSIQGSAVNYGQGDKFGKPFHLLSITELPPHTHGVNDSGHSHGLSNSYTLDPSDNFGGAANNGGMIPILVTAPQRTQPNTTGITLQSTGGGLAHENRDPSVAAVWIVKL